MLRAGQNALDATEQLPQLLVRIDALLTAAELIVMRADAAVGAVQQVIDRVERTRAEAALVVRIAAEVADGAAAVFAELQPLLASVTEIDPNLIRAVTRLADQLQPLMSAAGELDPDIPTQASDLLLRSKPVIEQIGPLVIPLLGELRAAVPDVRDILPVVQRLEPVLIDVETRLAGLPGAARLRRRGEREIEATATVEGARGPTEDHPQ